MSEGARVPLPAEAEIQAGLEDYYTTPITKEGLISEIGDTFELTTTEKPLKRSDVEKEVETFVENNFDRLLPILLHKADSHTDLSDLVVQLGLTNEDVGLMGGNTPFEKRMAKWQCTKLMNIIQKVKCSRTLMLT